MQRTDLPFDEIFTEATENVLSEDKKSVNEEYSNQVQTESASASDITEQKQEATKTETERGKEQPHIDPDIENVFAEAQTTVLATNTTNQIKEEEEQSVKAENRTEANKQNEQIVELEFSGFESIGNTLDDVFSEAVTSVLYDEQEAEEQVTVTDKTEQTEQATETNNVVVENTITATEETAEAEANITKNTISYLDYKGALWRAVDYILLDKPAVQIETNDVTLDLYNSTKAGLLRTAYQIRQELNKPVYTIINEEVLLEQVKTVKETIGHLVLLTYPKIKDALQEQATELVTEGKAKTVQEAKDYIVSELTAKLALDWLLLGLTQTDIEKIKNDEMLKIMVQEYLSQRDLLFEFVRLA